VLFLTFSWMAAPFRTLLYVMVFLSAPGRHGGAAGDARAECAPDGVQ
jgi:hypothetical protein